MPAAASHGGVVSLRPPAARCTGRKAQFISVRARHGGQYGGRPGIGAAYPPLRADACRAAARLEDEVGKRRAEGSVITRTDAADSLPPEERITPEDLAALDAALARLEESTERLTAAVSGSADDYARLADRLRQAG